MSKNKLYKVIIASAGDILVEGKIVCEVCSGVNAGLLANHTGITYQIKKWEEIFSSVLSPGEIAETLKRESDILVCIMHKRFGTSSTPGQPCNLESFLSAYDSWKLQKKPQVAFFFKEVKISSLKDIQDPQLIRVLGLKDKILNDRLLSVDEFKEPNEFCEKVQDRLDRLSCDS